MAKDIPHGTQRGYGHYKCRCAECVAAAREYRRRHYEANREKTAEDTRRWRAENPERIAAIQKRWRIENAERMTELQKRWRKANPEKVISQRSLGNHRRRARMRAAFVEDVPPLEIFERDNWQCQIPGCLYPDEPVKLGVGRSNPLLASLDHIVPLAKGGLHERSNLTTAHIRCNKVKFVNIEGIA